MRDRSKLPCSADSPARRDTPKNIRQFSSNIYITYCEIINRWCERRIPLVWPKSSIRMLIYTTNAVEGYHRQIRKVTKTKGAFPSDMALLKSVYLVTKNIEKKRTTPLHNWGQTVQQLAIKFGDRVPLELYKNQR